MSYNAFAVLSAVSALVDVTQYDLSLTNNTHANSRRCHGPATKAFESIAAARARKKAERQRKKKARVEQRRK